MSEHGVEHQEGESQVTMPPYQRVQTDLGGQTPAERAVTILRTMAPADGYVLCFSGGKDSVVLKAVANLAGVAYEAHYHVTTMDPPPVIQFIRQHHPDVIFDKPTHVRSFAQRLEDGRPTPTRISRWCCREFKERRFPGRVLLLGVRNAEGRHSGRVGVTRVCHATGETAVQPVWDWTTEDVWSFIRAHHLPYCSLYDEGWSRIGCICCPFASQAEIDRNRARWPAMFEAMRRGLRRGWAIEGKHAAAKRHWASADDLFEWWLSNRHARAPRRTEGLFQDT